VNSWNWEEHLTLIVGAGSTAIVMMRLLAVSDFDPETAFAILQSVGTTTVVIGTLLASIWVVVAFAGMAIMRYFVQHGINSWQKAAFDRAMVCASIVILLTAPTVAALLVIIMAIMWMHVRRTCTKAGKGAVNPARAFGEFVIGIAIALIILLGAYPWIPLERISVATQTKTHVGYVLRADGEMIVVLDDKRRRIDYLETKGLTASRELCNRHSVLKAKIIDEPILSYILSSSPQYPRC
jgi:hypothetical protein